MATSAAILSQWQAARRRSWQESKHCVQRTIGAENGRRRVLGLVSLDHHSDIARGRAATIAHILLIRLQALASLLWPHDAKAHERHRRQAHFRALGRLRSLCDCAKDNIRRRFKKVVIISWGLSLFSLLSKIYLNQNIKTLFVLLF